MKVLSLFFSLVFFVSSNTFAQSDKNTVTGTVKEVKPQFAGEHTLVVGDIELVLITDKKDKSGKTFEINKEFKNIVIDKKGSFILNPKYSDKQFKFTYTINGKGWKCIKNISAIKK